MNWLIIAIGILVMGMVAKPVRAATESHWYVGIGVGSSNVDKQGFDDDRGIKAFVGYDVSETFALEGGFIDAGDSHYVWAACRSFDPKIRCCERDFVFDKVMRRTPLRYLACAPGPSAPAGSGMVRSKLP